MVDFVANPKWESGIRQLETSDPVLAGPDGPDNIAPRQLANRTVFLKDALDHLFGETNNGDGSLDKSKLVLPVNRGGTGLSLIKNGQFLRGNADGGFSAITSTQLIEQLSAITFYSTIPLTQVGPVIYLLGRGLLEWQTIGNWSGYASLLLGAFLFDTTIVPRQFTIAAEGGNYSKSAYPALFAMAQNNGLVVGSAQWKKGEFKFVDLGGDLFKAPDIRDQFLRGTGTDADNANARLLGSHQADALQNITGSLVGSNGGIPMKPIVSASGALTYSATECKTTFAGSDTGLYSIIFDASRVARTATETRAANTALAPRIVAY